MIWLLACADPPPVTDSVVAEVAWTQLEAPRLYRRAHLDLTGALPEREDLDTLELDPDQLDPLLDALVQDPRVEDRLVVLFGERWLTQIDEYLFTFSEYAEHYHAGVPEYAFERAVANEPLHLMARIAVSDRPWTDIVTADHTMANELTGTAWPLEWPDGQTGWHETTYTDGRPGAGILSTNGLWWRYTTTFTNMNRGRVAMLSDQLVCEDILARPVDLAEAPVLTDEDSIEEAIRTVPYCQGCHAALDPAAAALFGFWTHDVHSRPEAESYHPEREVQGEDVLQVEMAWFGEPVDGLEGLGVAIANDVRFDPCATQRFAEMYWRRDARPDDAERLAELKAAFLENDRRALPLIRAVLDTPEYRAGELPLELVEGDEVVVRQMPPQLLAAAVEDATGFRWSFEGYDQLDNSVVGFRTLGGGVDGEFVTRPQAVPSASQLLVVRRVAELGSAHALESGALHPPNADVEGWIDALAWSWTARRLDETDLDGLVALYEAIATTEGDEAAAAAVASALLQDPEFWTW